MWEIVEGLHKALRIESTWVFVLISGVVFGLIGAGIGWVIDTGYRNSEEYKESHQSHRQQEDNHSATAAPLIAAKQEVVTANDSNSANKSVAADKKVGRRPRGDPPQASIDILCQQLANCPSAELSKRTTDIANEIDGIVDEYNKKAESSENDAQESQKQAGEGSAEFARIQHDEGVMLKDFAMDAALRYRRIEPGVLALRSVDMERLGRHDFSQDDWYEAAKEQKGDIIALKKVAADLHNLAADLLTMRR